MAEGDNDTCLELALEGEKLCKAGKCRDGVAFFEAALQVIEVHFTINIWRLRLPISAKFELWFQQILNQEPFFPKLL